MADNSVNQADGTGMTYYEICMEGDDPLLGSKTGECADLRAELNFVRKKDATARRFEARIRRQDLLKLLAGSKGDPDEWLDLRIRLRNL